MSGLGLSGHLGGVEYQRAASGSARRTRVPSSLVILSFASLHDGSIRVTGNGEKGRSGNLVAVPCSRSCG